MRTAAARGSALWASYTLRSRIPLNHRTTRRTYQGLIIREGSGYGCLHPWPELGDASLADHVAALLGKAAETPLLRGLRRCLQLDAAARVAGRSLIQDLSVPESHATVTSASIVDVERAAAAGFRVVKLKAGPDTLPAVSRLLEETPLPLRIDLNESGALSLLTGFWESLSDRARRHVAFLEDPFPYEPAVWAEWHRRTGCSLALDRQSDRMREGAFQILVLKPAADDMDAAESWLRTNRLPFCVTSYMDHPLGQAFAAQEAARLAAAFPELVLCCGLLTHLLFEPSAFSELLGTGPQWTPPKGCGLGFDALLEALPWASLEEWTMAST